ncbi:MAG: hypothetical protein BRD55_04300 [Bacteroidetes bacterium SW_9_63_38]|nr:MAG: hypothetical protein BRD55_04300 [Bacteroidetes bacterium SW_9_63_38]
MSDRALTQAFNNPGGGFKSIFDESGEDALGGLNGDGLSDLDGPSRKQEQKTMYVDESTDTPPQLEELNAFVQEGWEIADINLGYRKSDDDYCFVVTLEREAPRSFFEVAAF